MSHVPFPGSTLSCACIRAVLEQIDAAEAARSRSEGCEHCPGRLHGATYPRKPHALAPGLRDGVRRHGFCCAACRLRKTPPSVRFFDRRYRVAPVFLAACLTVLSGSAPVETAEARKAAERIALDDLTPRRVLEFLAHLEEGRGCSVQTRNQRLTAVRAFARFVASREPARLEWSAGIRSIALKKATAQPVGWLGKAEMEALIKVPDRGTQRGRTEHALLLFLFNSAAESPRRPAS